MEFQWDSRKEKENLRKHGVDFAEAVQCFLDPEGFAMVDRLHSAMEERFYWIGKNRNGRVLTIRYTRRLGAIRIIGAADWRKFREIYLERTKDK